MKRILVSISFFIFSAPCVFAADLGFRYDPYSGTCKNVKGDVGFNSDIEAIECADFQNVRITSMNFTGFRLLGFRISMQAPQDCHDQCENYFQDSAMLAAADARGLVAETTGFVNANFTGANLEKARFSGSLFLARGSHRSSFENANLKKADFRNAEFDSVIFKKADLRGADFSNAEFKECHMQEAVFDEFTRWPFSKEAALRLGMRYQESMEDLPTDDAGIISPPTHPAIEDTRLFQSSLFCGGNATSLDQATFDCQKNFGSQSARNILTNNAEVSWTLVLKNAAGTLWYNAGTSLFIWRASQSTRLSVHEGQRYCRELAWPAGFRSFSLTLATIEELKTAAHQGFRSLFSEVQMNQYWSSSARSSGSRKDLFFYYDGRNGTSTFFDFGLKKAEILCATRRNAR